MENVIIGRKKEKEELIELFHSGRAEFITVYGRRRVGKTYLINNLFANDYTSKVTAVLGGNTKEQLTIFSNALSIYGNESGSTCSDWFTAFNNLRALLENSKT